eukprot:jgi/Chrzof1/2569/Cz11g20200.t1
MYVVLPLQNAAVVRIAEVKVVKVGKESVWVHSTRTCRALTRADVRGAAEQTDRQTYETVSNLQSPTPHLLVASRM